MVLPRARNSTIETFNRLSSPFSDQSDLYLWDAEIPPHADLSGQTAGADGATSRGPIADVSSKPPAAAVQRSLPALVAAHWQCLESGGAPAAPSPPSGWDGMPTVGGATWLHPLAPVLPTPGNPSGGMKPQETARDASRPRCVFCNRSAGCCEDGWLLDARLLYRCELCY